MRKVILLTMIVGGLVALLRPQVASAQSLVPFSSIYAVKFVCGRQGPASTDLTLPAEPPVKPGNYATKINVELLGPGAITGSTLQRAVWNVSIASPAGDGRSTPAGISLSQLQTKDITCADIVKQASALFPAGAVLPKFINGYVNILTTSGVSLAVTGVYTSQGCFFEPGEAPICEGPVSIEVVPERAAPFTLSLG